MHLRNGQHGYGALTKLSHWLTVTAFVAQFLVGYTMQTEDDGPDVDCDPPGEDRSGGDLSDAEKDRLDRLEDDCEEAQDLRENSPRTSSDRRGTTCSVGTSAATG